MNNNKLLYWSIVVALAGFKPVTIGDGTANLAVTVALASSDVVPVRDQILLITNNNIQFDFFSIKTTWQVYGQFKFVNTQRLDIY